MAARQAHQSHRSPRASRHLTRRDRFHRKPDNSAPKTKKPLVLYAASVEEYQKLKRDYPGMKITLDPLQQTELFDSTDLIDV